MQKFINFFNVLKKKPYSHPSFDICSCWGVVLTILSVFLFCLFLLCSSVTDEQYHQVKSIAGQTLYPQTQAMAYQLLTQENIQKSDYFRLVRAYQFEIANIKTYPAEGR
ncbi:hypothetical protein [Acinetobacter nectaris]|uniref:hypothetical protein n=1 Tax=Acinetobacter nectaris TaxID=1219382 RepID=UPI001F2A6582|nr:hypothetical protein [Acinetobacter nectaris]MCF8998692.1 hypothetical protein [Acinetobacter nectaris]MCF9026394.1 hypothetical protein [Acinetobacter nectaris]